MVANTHSYNFLLKSQKKPVLGYDLFLTFRRGWFSTPKHRHVTARKIWRLARNVEHTIMRHSLTNLEVGLRSLCILHRNILS